MKNLILAGLLVALSVASCADAETSANSSGLPSVVTTTGMIGDAVKNIAGDLVSVTSLMGPGVDPHLYRASAGDVRRLSQADLIFYNGLHLEAKMGEVLEQMNGSIATVAIADDIPADQLVHAQNFAVAHDPHIWFDVRLWASTTSRVRDALIELLPDQAEKITQNHMNYIQQLDELDSYVRTTLAPIPEEQRILVTAHDAFHYFGNAYGFEVRGLQGISTVAETGTEDVQNLAAFITERRIPAIFIESSVPRRSIEALQAAVKSRGFDVAIGGELFSDAMGDAGTVEGTYVGMVRHNVDTLARAFLGD